MMADAGSQTLRVLSTAFVRYMMEDRLTMMFVKVTNYNNYVNKISQLYHNP